MFHTGFRGFCQAFCLAVGAAVISAFATAQQFVDPVSQSQETVSEEISLLTNTWLAVNQGRVLSIRPNRALPGLFGAQLEHYLFTVSGPNGLRVVAHQVEEFDAQQLFNENHAKRDQNQGIFDAQDELLIPAWLLGKPWEGQALPPGTSLNLARWLSEHVHSIYQIQHLGPSGSAYGYLWRLNQPVPERILSTDDYVSYDEQTHFAETNFYSLASDLDNPLVWQDLVIDGIPKQRPRTVLDTLSLRLLALTMGRTSTISLTNSNIRAEVLSVVDGPLRTRVDMVAKAIFGGFVVGQAKCQLIILPRAVKLRVTSSVPNWVSHLLSEASLGLTLDGVQLTGGRVSASGTPMSVGLIDGRLSAVESLFSQTGFEPNRYWWFITHPAGLVMFSDLTLEDQVAFPVSMIYQDDQRRRNKNKSERFSGLEPLIGYHIDNLPLKKPFKMQMSLYFDRPQTPYLAKAYVDMATHEPEIVVEAKSLEMPLTLPASDLL